MRIISGKCRGRKLCAPGPAAGKGGIRPTSDRVRESIFNIIAGRPAGSKILDLFAGTGALGLEALSRGGESAVFVDLGTDSLALLRKNIELCGFPDRSTVIRRDLARSSSFLQGISPAGGFDLIFLDPPYRRGLAAGILAVLGEAGLLAPGGLVIAEEAAGEKPADSWPGLILIDQRVYGDTAIWFYGADPKENV